MGWVKRVPSLGEAGPAVQAACDENIVGGRNSMVGHAYLVSPVGSYPLPVINWNASSGWVEKPRAASVFARGHVDIRQWGRCGQTCYVDVEEAVQVSNRRDCNVSIAACRGESNSSRGGTVRQRKSGEVLAAVG